MTPTKGMILREPFGPITSEPTYLVSRLEHVCSVVVVVVGQSESSLESVAVRSFKI